MTAIAEQLLEPARATVPGLVNVFAGVPFQDPFWRGNLIAIRQLLALLGLRANVLFGPRSGGVQGWREIPAAQFNLVLSCWAGVAPARTLERRFGTPWLHHPVLPIGAAETGRFLRAVAEFADIDPASAEAAIAEQEDVYYYHFERAAEFLLEARCDLPSHFVTVSDSFYGLGISRLLDEEFGLLPAHLFVTDDPPAEFRGAIVERFTTLPANHAADQGGLKAGVTFTEDGDVIRQTLRTLHAGIGPAFVFGSSWDRAIAQELEGLHLSIATPVADRLVLDCSYIGYSGALRLLEDVMTARLGRIQ